MHPSSLLPRLLADIHDSIGPLIGLAIPVVALMVGGAIAICALYFRHRQQELWHETARVALEKGQPIPPMPAPDHDETEASLEPKSRAGQDLRAGLILIAIGAGLWFFLGAMGGFLRYVGLIPGFIGIALTLFGAISLVLGRPQGPRPPRP